MAELLVSHLQHLYDGKHLALLGLRDSVYGEQEVGEVSPLGTARYGVDIQRRKCLVTILVLYSRVGHHHRPDVARTAPCLQLRQHQSHLLRLRGTAAALGHVDEHIWVYHQIIYLLLLAVHHRLHHSDDVVAVGQAGLCVEIHHVLRQEVQHPLVLLPSLFGRFCAVHILRVPHPQGNAGNLPHVLALDRFLEREERHALLVVVHQMRHQTVEEIRLSRVRATGEDDESALGSGVEDAVGESAHPHLVATVVVAHHDVEDVLLVLGEVVDVGVADALRFGYDSLHLAASECLIYLADVLLALRQRGNLGAGLVLLYQEFYQSAARAVGIAADDDFARLLNPLVEGLVTLLDVGAGAVGDAQHVGESAGHQRESVLFALGDNELADGLCVGSEQVDAVDAVGCAGLGGGNLAEELAPFAGDGVLLHGAELHVDDLAVQIVAVGDGRHHLHAFRVLAFGVIRRLLHPCAHHSFLYDDVGRELHCLDVSLHHPLERGEFAGGNQGTGLGMAREEVGGVEVVDELLLLFLGLEGVDGVEPGSGFGIYLAEVVGQHGHVVFGLVFILLLFLGVGVVVSVHLTAALSEQRFHLFQVSAPVARPAVGQSVIHLDEAACLSAFRACNLDIELSSRHQLYGFLADVLQVIEEGLEGWSII